MYMHALLAFCPYQAISVTPPPSEVLFCQGDSSVHASFCMVRWMTTWAGGSSRRQLETLESFVLTLVRAQKPSGPKRLTSSVVQDGPGTETRTAGTILPGTQSGTGTAGAVLQEPKPEPCLSVKTLLKY